MSTEDRDPSRTTRRSLLDAWHDGVLAGRAGRPLSACPHLPPYDGPGRLLALWWLRGHQVVTGRARRTDVDARPTDPVPAPRPDPW